MTDRNNARSGVLFKADKIASGLFVLACLVMGNMAFAQIGLVPTLDQPTQSDQVQDIFVDTETTTLPLVPVIVEPLIDPNQTSSSDAQQTDSTLPLVPQVPTDDGLTPKEPTILLDLSTATPLAPTTNADTSTTAVPVVPASETPPVAPQTADPAATALEPPQTNALDTIQNAITAALDALLDGATPYHQQASQALYANTNFTPIWSDGISWFNYTLIAHEALLSAADDGLLVHHYLPTEYNFLPQPNTLSNEQLAALDVVLTLGFSSYLSDLIDGRSNIEKRREPHPGFFADQALRSGAIADWLNTNRPQNRQYQALRTALLGLDPSNPKRLQLAINMERWRKDKEYFADKKLIKINLPTYHLEAWNGFTPQFDMPVVVGKPSRQTPLIERDRIVSLKFSPDWGVPTTIEQEDIIPILQNRPEIFEKMGFEVFQAQQKVDYRDLDWSKIDPKNNNISFRQPPGGDNALGGIRFSLTNSFDIYLHDSPDRMKFEEPDRAFSSGCVRVGDAEKLAEWLLQEHKGWDRLKIRDMMGRTQSFVEPLKQPVEVTFTYYTAWATPDGRIRYGKDIYGHDAQMIEQIDFGANLTHPAVIWVPPAPIENIDKPNFTP